MEKLFNRFVLIAPLLFVLLACQTHTVDMKREGDKAAIIASALKELDEENIQAVRVDYVADCKVRLKTRVETNSGSCHIALTHDRKFLFTVLHPLGGLVLKIYADSSVLQVKDFRKKTFHEYELSNKKQLNIPLLKDFSLVELQSVLWGRVLKPVESKLSYEMDDARRLKKIVKILKKGELVVEYNRWLSYNGSQFPSILLMNNQGSGSSIKLAVTNFQPGYVSGIKLVKGFRQRRNIETGSFN